MIGHRKEQDGLAHHDGDDHRAQADGVASGMSDIPDEHVPEGKAEAEQCHDKERTLQDGDADASNLQADEDEDDDTGEDRWDVDGIGLWLPHCTSRDPQSGTGEPTPESAVGRG